MSASHSLMGNGRPDGRWLVRKANPSAVLRLVCFPYAGANASIFGSWHLSLPENVEVCAIQLPGRRNRFLESPYRRVELLVADLGAALLPLLDKPFAFFGHSMGAILSFEMTKWLRNSRNRMPEALFVSGRRAPQIPDTDPCIYLMDDANFIAEIRKLNGTPKEVLAEPDVLQVVLPALRADTELGETYEYVDSVPLSCPIIGFCGTNDDEETVERMEAWRLRTTEDFTLHVVQGDHFFIHSSEQRVLELLRIELLNNVGKNTRD